MKRILIVEDNKISGSMIHKKISSSVDDPVLLASDMQSAITLLNEHNNDFYAAFLDYVLPDAPNGEIIDEVISRGISSVVFTANVTERVRNQLWKKGIVDYVIKDSAQSVNYLTFILSRLKKNQKIKALIVDDSNSFRMVIRRLLLVHNFHVIEAQDGSEALKTIKLNPDIKVIVTDNEMPGVDGMTLTRKLRQKYGNETLSIIGVTSDSNKMTGARFIKSGANDFIDKSNFIIEEFYCRINHCLENMEKVEIIRNIATTDDLTGLYNRKYFYDTTEKIYSSAQRSKHSIAFAILDIDHFKNINDTYGHVVGDKALIHIAKILKNHLLRPSDIVGRFGGEEFVIFLDNISHDDAFNFFEKLRQSIANQPFKLDSGKEVFITTSIGVQTTLEENIDASLKKADELLYQAKESGRNMVVINDDEND